MRHHRIVHQGVRALATSKLRTFFMMAGTIVGVAALTIIMALGTGTEKKVMKRVRNFGPRAMMLIAGGGKDLPPCLSGSRRRKTRSKACPRLDWGTPCHTILFLFIQAIKDRLVRPYRLTLQDDSAWIRLAKRHPIESTVLRLAGVALAELAAQLGKLDAAGAQVFEAGRILLRQSVEQRPQFSVFDECILCRDLIAALGVELLLQAAVLGLQLVDLRHSAPHPRDRACDHFASHLERPQGVFEA